MTDPGPGGYIHFLPFQTSGMVINRMITSLHPWGSPSVYAAMGHCPDDSSRAMVCIGYEWPVKWLQTFDPLGKWDLEWTHVQGFRTQHLLALGYLPFLDVQRGEDPPDVRVQTAEGVVGLECTRLTFATRQVAYGLFRTVRQRIMELPEHFSALFGHVIYLWFNNEDNSALTLPHRRSDDEAADELVRALAEYTPQAAALWNPAGAGLPEPAPPLHSHRTSAGAAFYAVPLSNAVPDSPLFNVTGFELALAYSTEHYADNEWSMLQGRIARKDREGSDWLLITVGGPDNAGTIYPSEEVLGEFIIEHAEHLVAPHHLRRITLHFWGRGRAVDIWPEVAPIFGPLYAGIAPVHRPLVPQQQAP